MCEWSKYQRPSRIVSASYIWLVTGVLKLRRERCSRSRATIYDSFTARLVSYNTGFNNSKIDRGLSSSSSLGSRLKSLECLYPPHRPSIMTVLHQRSVNTSPLIRLVILCELFTCWWNVGNGSHIGAVLHLCKRVCPLSCGGCSPLYLPVYTHTVICYSRINSTLTGLFFNQFRVIISS